MFYLYVLQVMFWRTYDQIVIHNLRGLKVSCFTFLILLYTFLIGASLEPLAQCRNVASLSLFCRYYFGRCSSDLAQLVSIPFSWGRCTRYSDRLHAFFVTIPRCYKYFSVNSFFPCTARLWNSLPVECFPLNYNVNGLKLADPY